MLTFIVEELVVGLGLKVALAPVGNPLALKMADPVNPPEGVIFTV